MIISAERYVTRGTFLKKTLKNTALAKCLLFQGPKETYSR